MATDLCDSKPVRQAATEGAAAMWVSPTPGDPSRAAFALARRRRGWRTRGPQLAGRTNLIDCGIFHAAVGCPRPGCHSGVGSRETLTDEPRGHEHLTRESETVRRQNRRTVKQD